MSVVQKFDADGAAVERELEKLRNEYDKLKKKMEEVDRYNVNASKTTTRAIDQQVIALGAAVAGYVSLSQAIQAVNREMEREIALKNKIRNTSIDVASSQTAVRHNIGDVSNETFRSFLAEVVKIQEIAKFSDIKQMNLAAAGVLSATGSNQRTTLDVLRATAPIFRDRPELLSEFSGGVADVMSASGSTAEEATALALAGFGQSRTTSLSAFKNVAQAVKSGSAFSGVGQKQSAEEVMALFGTISRASGDVEGGASRTAVVKFMQKMEEFGGEGGLLDRLTTVQQGIAAGTIKESSVLSGFEAQAVGGVRDLLRADPAVDKDLRDTVAATKASQEAYNRLVRDLEMGTEQIATATRSSQNRGAAQKRSLGDGSFVSSAISEMFETRNEFRADAKSISAGQAMMNAISDTVYGVRGMGDEDFQAKSVIDGVTALLNNMRFQVRQAEERPGLYGTPSENLLSDIKSAEDTLKTLEKIYEEIKAYREGGIEAVQRMRSDPRTAASTQAERD
jgi:ASC-1-like (ASCH) protein